MYYIYKIENKINHKVYIGQTLDPNSRKSNHFRNLTHGSHSNPYLQKDFNVYGEQNFEFIIIDSCGTLEESLILENKYMDYYGGTNSDNIYNVRGNGNGKSNLDYRKLLNSHLNPTAFKGHVHSTNTKQQISATLKEGYKSGKNKKVPMIGEENPFYGKKHSEKTRKCISECRTKMRKYSSDFIDALIDEYNNGLSYKQLNEKYNISIYTLPILIKHKEDYLKYGSGKNYKKFLKSVTTNGDECNRVD